MSFSGCVIKAIKANNKFPENEPSQNNCPLLYKFGQNVFDPVHKLLFCPSLDDFIEKYDKILMKVLPLRKNYKCCL